MTTKNKTKEKYRGWNPLFAKCRFMNAEYKIVVILSLSADLKTLYSCTLLKQEHVSLECQERKINLGLKSDFIALKVICWNNESDLSLSLRCCEMLWDVMKYCGCCEMFTHGVIKMYKLLF